MPYLPVCALFATPVACGFSLTSGDLAFSRGRRSHTAAIHLQYTDISHIPYLRKALPEPQPAFPEARGPGRARGADDRIAELQLENSWLRRLVTDLLLEKIKLEEAAKLSA
jgi:hypothetical protein